MVVAHANTLRGLVKIIDSELIAGSGLVLYFSILARHFASDPFSLNHDAFTLIGRDWG